MSSHSKTPAAAILLIPVAVAVILTLFAWPNARLHPRELPIGVAGQGATTVQAALEAEHGAFDVHRYADEAAAREAIENRDIYGAFVLGPGGPTVLTATAASPAVAQLLGHAAAELSESPNAVPVVDVVSAPRGAALASSVLPMVLAGILTGALAAAIAAGGFRRAGLVLLGSALAGLTATVIIQNWLRVIDGHWLVNVAALALTVLAISSVVAGLHRLWGAKGIGLGAATMVLIGNPFSAVGAAPELMPKPVGGIGQLLPPGAGGNLLRSTGFFDGAGSGSHLLVLAVWAVCGLAMCVIRRPTGVPASAFPDSTVLATS